MVLSVDSQYLRHRVKQASPRRVNSALRRVRTVVDHVRTRGDTVWCPICEKGFGRFLPYHGRTGALCPGCHSLERHRLLWDFFVQKTNLFTASLRLLHIAPEIHLGGRLAALHNLDYISADLLSGETMLRLDVTDIDLPDESFDVVLCSHVMEHVGDDSRAMRELLRITRRGGWGILDAPVDWGREDTYEDWSITEHERVKAFGQFDHVRVYGRNYPELLRAAGWRVELDPLDVSEVDRVRQGLRPGIDRLFYCRRPS